MSPAFRRERAAVESLVNAIPDEPFKRWVTGHVMFDRVSRGRVDFKAGVRPGLIDVYDPFWASDVTDTGRTNILTFELAKALWFDRINRGSREERPPRLREFEAIVERHPRAIDAMKFAALRGEDLGALTDRDPQSQFAYACRVVLFGLEPAAVAPAGCSAAAWAGVKLDWRAARDEMRRYLAVILADPQP